MPEFHTYYQLFVQKVFSYDPPVSQGTSVTDGRTDRWQPCQ